MNQDTAWNATSTSYDPLVLIQLIEKTVLAQTEDQYPFATVYDQELTFYTFHQWSMTNPQWYERFNKKVDVSESIGVTWKHKSLLEYVAQESHLLDFDSCTEDQQAAEWIDSEESYIYYLLSRQSGK